MNRSPISRRLFRPGAERVSPAPRRPFRVATRRVSPAVQVPLLGVIAAGRPLDAVEVLDEDALVDIPASYLSSGEHFALRVVGDSMIEDGICDGDLILVRRQNRAEPGQTAVALVDGEATVKKLYYHGEQAELRPANAAMQSLFVPRDRLVIQGVVISLLRRY